MVNAHAPSAGKQGQVLDSAAEIFLEKGYHGARMQEIADRAGVNKALLHYYYRNKSNLYEEALRFLFRRNFGQLVEQLRPAATFAGALRYFVDSYIDLLADNPLLPGFMLHELAAGGRAITDVVRELLDQNETVVGRGLDQLVKQAVWQGEIRQQSLPQLVMTVLGACIYSFIATPLIEVFLPAGSTGTQEFLEARKQAVYDTIYLGMKTRERE